MSKLPIMAAALGLAAGVAVTRHAHESPSSPWWDERVGSTPLRRSDLPVGGTLAFVAARSLRRRGHRGTAGVVRGLGLGAALGAVGTGLLDPLPSA
ncbi:MAG: hypothetical protein DLM57_02785 [Pseudonocardiales bacterium]|nr:MAG: hypothetical protein DLM57_02785 [Pseudonocardiales bacterium]